MSLRHSLYPLPDNWEKLSEDARTTYKQNFVGINKSKAGDKSTQAKKIIHELYQNNTISARSKELLTKARILVDKGSSDTIKDILDIGQELKEQDSHLFAIEQQNIDEILERKIGKLADTVEIKQGEASIVLGTIK